MQFLNELKVAGHDGKSWVQGSVILQKYEVPELVEITVIEGPLNTLEPGQTVAAPPLSQVVPIPVIREEC